MFGKSEGKGTKFNPDGTSKGSEPMNTVKTGRMGSETLKSAKGLKPATWGNGKGGKVPTASLEKMKKGLSIK